MNEVEFIVTRIIKVESTYVHLKFHFSFPRGLPVNYEHAIVAIVRDSVVLDNITQGKYVGDTIHLGDNQPFLPCD
jgi:hypothetical protein